MSVITEDFVAAGKPTYIVANAGVMYTDITDGIVYKQTTIPFGKSWKVVSNQNVYTPNSGVTSVNANTPLSSTGGKTPTINIQQAGPTQDGYLSAADWNTFNAGSGGGVTDVTASAPIQSSGGVTPDISIPQAGALTDGFLSSADWGVFNGKFPYPTGTTSEYIRGDGSLATFPTAPTVTPAALTKTDDTNVTLALTGTPTTALLQAVNIAVGWSGTLADSRIASASTWNSKVSSVAATGPITSSGGTTPTISTSMATNKLIGRSTAGTGVMEEITIGSGLSLSSGTLDASPSHSITHATASGTDTYTTSITGVTSYADGDVYLIRFTNGNTTGATLNINSLGAVTLYRNNDGALIGGDIQDGGEMLCVYNSSSAVFQCIGTSPNSLIAYVTNAESISITKGQPVYAFGGVGDRLKVKLAYNTSDATSAQTIGLVLSASIGANQKGFIMMQGLLDGLSILPTSTWADGDPVYLGATAGSITNVKQYAPNHLVYLGFVTTASNGSAGRLYVRVQNGYELDELHNVQAQSPSNKDTIYYDSASSQWKTASLATILGYTPANAATAVTSVTGTSPVVSSGGLTPAISIPKSNASTNGYLSSIDWTKFDNAVTDRRSGNYYRKSQRWYVPSDNTNTLTATNHSTPSVFLVPFPVHATMVIDQIAIEVTSAGAVGSNLRFGIYYGDTTTVVPTNLIVDSGDISAATIGVKTFTPGSPITLGPGLYFTAFSTSSATAHGIRSLTTTNFAQVIGLTAAGGTSLGTYINGTRAAYGALPANASSLTALNPTIGNIYALFYRIQ